MTSSTTGADIAPAAPAARVRRAAPRFRVWEAETDNSPGLRFYERLGARLRTKVTAAWLPDGYGECLAVTSRTLRRVP
jgi:hypothetical protein